MHRYDPPPDIASQSSSNAPASAKRQRTESRSLQPTSSNEIQISEESHNLETQHPVTNPKPIFVEYPYKSVANIINNITSLKSVPLLKKMPPRNAGKDSTKVLVATQEDKETLLKVFKKKIVPFHTFSEPQVKPSIFVLKGFERLALDEMKQKLIDINLPVVNVSFLKDAPEYPLYLISFERLKINIVTLQQQVKSIDNLIVKWERFDRIRKRITQCHNCQQFGHAASNCGKKYRCVKCTGDHQPKDCPRKSREDQGTPKCVNCGGEHAANYSKCPKFISYSNVVNQHRVNRQAAAQQFTTSAKKF